jgi:hypothetical protein
MTGTETIGVARAEAFGERMLGAVNDAALTLIRVPVAGLTPCWSAGFRRQAEDWVAVVVPRGIAPASSPRRVFRSQ